MADEMGNFVFVALEHDCPTPIRIRQFDLQHSSSPSCLLVHGQLLANSNIMRLSCHLIAIATTFVLVGNHALSTATGADQNMAAKMRPLHSSPSFRVDQPEVDKVQGWKRFLKSTAKSTDEIGNGEEERGLSFSSLKNLFKSSASKKAAAAAKQVQRDQLVAKLAENGNYRIDMFNTWIKQSYTPNKMFADFNAAANKNALSVFHSYNQHLKDLRVVL